MLVNIHNIFNPLYLFIPYIRSLVYPLKKRIFLQSCYTRILDFGGCVDALCAENGLFTRLPPSRRLLAYYRSAVILPSSPGTTEGPQCNDSCRVWYGRCNKERIDARRRGGRRQFVSLRAMRGRCASGSASGDFPLSFDWPKEFLPRFRSLINARVRKRALVKLKYQLFSV